MLRGFLVHCLYSPAGLSPPPEQGPDFFVFAVISTFAAAWHTVGAHSVNVVEWVNDSNFDIWYLKWYLNSWFHIILV